MKSQSVGNWFQFVSMVAVMVGLILVIWELRQAREIVAAQIGADAFILMSQQSAAVMGEDAAKAIAKACDHPESLTTEEMVVLSSYYAQLIQRIRRTFIIDRRSDILEGDGGWQQWAALNFSAVFSTSFGRWWWNTTAWEPEIKGVGDEILRGMGPPDCEGYFKGFKESLAANVP